MYSVLNKPLEYIYVYWWKNTTSYAFLLVFKIVESLQCSVFLITAGKTAAVVDSFSNFQTPTWECPPLHPPISKLS